MERGDFVLGVYCPGGILSRGILERGGYWNGGDIGTGGFCPDTILKGPMNKINHRLSMNLKKDYCCHSITHDFHMICLSPLQLLHCSCNCCTYG